MSVALHIAEGLNLPIDLATQTILIVGKRGSGKSTTCVRLAEQFFKAKIPFVSIDPTDTWYGLKASKDGKGPGLGVYIFGGRHADLPLESTAGALVADVVVDHRISAVLSIKHFSGRERGRFVSDFADRLYHRNTEPLHLFLEEAHEVAPQQPFKGEEEMLGRVTRIWKLGRSSGLGGSAITQRPASLSKNITTQAEVLIVHRILGPQDVAAIREWIKYHGESDQVLSQLSGLKTGEAWLWAPDFPEGSPIGLRRVKILDRETFNSSATPKAGERQTEPKVLAPVDLDALRSKMAATIERSKADDPKELRKKLAAKDAEIRKLTAGIKPVDPEALERARQEGADNAARQFRGETKKLQDKIKDTAQLLAGIRGSFDKACEILNEACLGEIKAVPFTEVMSRPNQRFKAPAFRPTPPILPRRNKVVVEDDGNLTGPEQRILDAIAWMESIGVNQPEQPAVAFLAGYRIGGGAWNNPRGRLRTRGLVEYAGNCVLLTEAGRALANKPDTPATTEGLHAAIMARLRGPEQKILRVILERYPHSISNEECAAEAGYSLGGAYNNPRGRLRTLGLIEYPSGGMLRARNILFLE